MSAIPLTVFLSLALAGLFTVLFWREQRRRHFGSAERDSLLPLADEAPRPARVDADAADKHAHDHEHAADGGPCGCRTGLRPPCAGCQRAAVIRR